MANLKLKDLFGKEQPTRHKTGDTSADVGANYDRFKWITGSKEELRKRLAEKNDFASVKGTKGYSNWEKPVEIVKGAKEELKRYSKLTPTTNDEVREKNSKTQSMPEAIAVRGIAKKGSKHDNLVSSLSKIADRKENDKLKDARDEWHREKKVYNVNNGVATDKSGKKVEEVIPSTDIREINKLPARKRKSTLSAATILNNNSKTREWKPETKMLGRAIANARDRNKLNNKLGIEGIEKSNKLFGNDEYSRKVLGIKGNHPEVGKFVRERSKSLSHAKTMPESDVISAITKARFERKAAQSGSHAIKDYVGKERNAKQLQRALDLTKMGARLGSVNKKAEKIIDTREKATASYHNKKSAALANANKTNSASRERVESLDKSYLRNALKTANERNKYRKDRAVLKGGK